MKAISLALCLSVCLFACTNPIDGHKSADGSSLRVSLGSPAARTIAAGSSDLLGAVKAYKVTVSNTTNSYSGQSTGTVDCTINGMAPGTYDVAVKAYSDTGCATEIASGNLSSVAIAANATASKTVYLSFTQSGTGGYSLVVAWPTSAALPYICTKLDSGTTTTPVLGTINGSNYETTISASSLMGGNDHTISIYFAATSSSTALIGPYVESINIWDGVTDTMWIDWNGVLSNKLTFTPDELSSSNANMGNISFTNASSVLAGFAPGTNPLPDFTTNTFTFTANCISGAQNLSYKWNTIAGTGSWASNDVTKFTSSTLNLATGTNTLDIVITAPDRQTKKTYTFTVSCGGLKVGVDVNYQGMSFSSSNPTIFQGSPIAFETSNPTLDAITSNWAWYIDDVKQSETSQRFVLSSAATSSMIGTYHIAATVKGADGVTYSGRIALTVMRTALGMTPATANVTTLASSGFSSPTGITTDGTNLYVADKGNNCILKIDASGVVTTLAGSTTSGHADGTGTAATFNSPIGITTDGSNLYVADAGNNEIRKIVIGTGVVTTLAGSTTGGHAEGTGTAATFNCPCAIATDGANLYVADTYNHCIRMIVIATGVVSTLTGSDTGTSTSGYVNDTGTSARFNEPRGIATDGTNLYVGDTKNNCIRKVVITSKVVTTLAGDLPPGASGSTDATGNAARFYQPYGLATDGTNLFVADTMNNEIRKIMITSAAVTTLAGSTTSGNVNGVGTSARFTNPEGIATDGVSLYIADFNNHAIRKIQ